MNILISLIAGPADTERAQSSDFVLSYAFSQLNAEKNINHCGVLLGVLGF